MIRGVRFLARSAVMAALEISSIDDMLFKGAARWQYSEVGMESRQMREEGVRIKEEEVA